MNIRLILLIVAVAVAVIMLVAYIRRLQRKSNEIEKTLDYSRMKEWKDDD